MPVKISNPIVQLDGKVGKYRVLEQSNPSSPYHQVRYSLIQSVLAHTYISSFLSVMSHECRKSFGNRIVRIRKQSAAFFRTHKMSLGRWTRERGKEPEQEGAIQGDQHGLKGDDQFDENHGGENKHNQDNGEKQVTSL